MKTMLFCFFLSLFVLNKTTAQDIPVTIKLNDGQTIEAKHFGQLDCSGTLFFDNYILIKGKYNDMVTELKDYSKVSKIEFIGFEKKPTPTGGNEKGQIVVTRKNGVRVALENANISLSCYGVEEQYNQLQVQTINPLTDETVETKVNVKDIQEIVFK